MGSKSILFNSIQKKMGAQLIILKWLSLDL